jgi:putative acetyltransferase
MTKQNFKIEKFTDRDREQILDVWEKSVLATHDFLNPIDFEEIKKIVASFNFNDFKVYCLKQNDVVAGFIGLAAQKIEMLFLSPEYIGKGLGYRLLEFAVVTLKAHSVDVNEQNTNAKYFYEKFGFTVYDRTDIDDLGKHYPLLRMKIQPKA